MNGNRGGWVPIQRTLLGSDIWLLPDGQRIVYVTLQLLANHAAKTWTWRGQEYSVQPGQLVTSSERLAAAAGVTRQTVRSALKNLAQLGALINESTKSGVLITLTSWGLCQSGGGKATNQRINQQMAKTQPRDQPTDQPTKKNPQPLPIGVCANMAVEKQPTEQPTVQPSNGGKPTNSSTTNNNSNKNFNIYKKFNNNGDFPDEDREIWNGPGVDTLKAVLADRPAAPRPPEPATSEQTADGNERPRLPSCREALAARYREREAAELATKA